MRPGFARPLPIWTMQPAFEPAVIETLKLPSATWPKRKSGGRRALCLRHNAVADNITDYLQDPSDCREDSLLEELDDLNLEVFYRDALEVSVWHIC